MQLLNKLKLMTQNAWFKITNRSAVKRLARLERNYLMLLKRLLEIDGVQLEFNPKSSNLTTKIFQTPTDEQFNHGLNDYKPTLH